MENKSTTSRQKPGLESALVICTLNRPGRVREFLEYFLDLDFQPKFVVYVDSSESSETERVVREFKNRNILNFQLEYAKSLNGAAHQKNVGFDIVSQKYSPDDLVAIHFLDDDIIPNEHYFKNVVDLFNQAPQAVVIGGFDYTLQPFKRSRLRDSLLLTKGAKTGVCLKSGICIVPYPEGPLEEVEWVPGGMQNFSFPKSYNQRFDGRVRIYGDEVEMHLRLAKLGKIYVSNMLGVNHKSETIAKDSNRIEQSYMDGFRWTLARTYPEKFKKYAVLYSTFAIMAGELVRSAISRDRLAFSRFLGHIDFIIRLLGRKPLQQYVAHEGSGPFIGMPRK